MKQINDSIIQLVKTRLTPTCLKRKCTFAMKNGLLLLFVVFILAFSSCSKYEATETITENIQQTQQQSITPTQEVTQEPEFVIEADYDPALAEKAEKNKRNKTEKTSPIVLTSDDDDLEEDKDDLPVKVMTRSITAYDYETTDNNPSAEDEEPSIEAIEGNHKGGSKPIKTGIKENTQALYFVVAGAYRDADEAKKKSKIIEGLGYKVELISFDNNFKTVCIAKLESRSQADLLAKSLQNDRVDAYVVKRRK